MATSKMFPIISIIQSECSGRPNFGVAVEVKMGQVK